MDIRGTVGRVAFLSFAAALIFVGYPAESLGEDVPGGRVFEMKGGVVSKASRSTLFVEGVGELVKDFVTQPVYGGNDIFMLRSGFSGPKPFGPSEQVLHAKVLPVLDSAIGNIKATNQSMESIQRLLGLIYNFSVEGRVNADAPAEPDEALDYVRNLISRKTGPRDVALATHVLFAAAGMKTRIVRILKDMTRPGSGGYSAIEFYAERFGKWVLVDPSTNYIPTKDGIPLSIFELYWDPKVLEVAKRVAPAASYSLGNIVHMFLPNPTYGEPVEVFWSPSKGVVDKGLTIQSR